MQSQQFLLKKCVPSAVSNRVPCSPLAIMSEISLSGPVRLGIVLSVGWLTLCPLLYFLAIWAYPNFVTDHAAWAFSWHEEPEVSIGGIDFRPLRPGVAWVLYALCMAPIVTSWVLLFALPRAIYWVRDGFRP